MTCVFLPVIQTYTAIYYVVADVAMLSLYFYYKLKNRMGQSECFFVCQFNYSIFYMPNEPSSCFVLCEFQCLIWFPVHMPLLTYRNRNEIKNPKHVFYIQL